MWIRGLTAQALGSVLGQLLTSCVTANGPSLTSPSAGQESNRTFLVRIRWGVNVIKPANTDHSASNTAKRFTSVNCPRGPFVPACCAKMVTRDHSQRSRNSHLGKVYFKAIHFFCFSEPVVEISWLNSRWVWGWPQRGGGSGKTRKLPFLICFVAVV